MKPFLGVVLLVFGFAGPAGADSLPQFTFTVPVTLTNIDLSTFHKVEVACSVSVGNAALASKGNITAHGSVREYVTKGLNDSFFGITEVKLTKSLNATSGAPSPGSASAGSLGSYSGSVTVVAHYDLPDPSKAASLAAGARSYACGVFLDGSSPSGANRTRSSGGTYSHPFDDATLKDYITGMFN